MTASLYTPESATFRQPFCNDSATLRQPFRSPSGSSANLREVFGKHSGSNPESFASSASLRDASGRFRRLIRNPSATASHVHAEYMRNTCRAHAKWSLRSFRSRRVAEVSDFRLGTLRQGFGVLVETGLYSHAIFPLSFGKLNTFIIALIT